MIPFLVLAALAGATVPCSSPVARHPSYITPGALGDVVYSGDLALDAYAPSGEPRLAAVIIHGSHGNKTTHLTQLFEAIERGGFAWFSVDYHNPGDVADAIRYIRCPGRFNITDDVVLIGEDTGAEIALKLAARGGFRSVVTFGAQLSPRSGDFAPPTVPALMFHGTSDEESPLRQAEALCKKMPHCVFYPVTGGVHDFENWHPEQWHWKEELTAWLRQDRRGLAKDIAYARPDGRELLMDAFLPEGRGPFPAVIIAHGGGWEAGDKVTYVSPVFEPLARGGFAWFSIDYRLTPYVRVPDQLEDLRAAIRYVRGHAASFHIDPNRLALLGESASGHLVSQVASTPCAGCEVQAVVSFYGVYNFAPWSQASEAGRRAALQRLFGEARPEILRSYSPIDHVTTELPPTLLIQGTADDLYTGTLEYAARLKDVHARYELVLLDGAPHGMENWEGHPEWAFYKQKLVEWLLSVVGRP